MRPGCGCVGVQRAGREAQEWPAQGPGCRARRKSLPCSTLVSQLLSPVRRCQGLPSSLPRKRHYVISVCEEEVGTGKLCDWLCENSCPAPPGHWSYCCLHTGTPKLTTDTEYNACQGLANLYHPQHRPSVAQMKKLRHRKVPGLCPSSAAELRLEVKAVWCLAI